MIIPTVHMKNQKILGISYKDHVTNEEVCNTAYWAKWTTTGNSQKKEIEGTRKADNK